MCEPGSPSRESIFASHCFFFYLFIKTPKNKYINFMYLFFGVFNLTLMFSSVNGALAGRNTSFRFSFVDGGGEIPRK